VERAALKLDDAERAVPVSSPLADESETGERAIAASGTSPATSSRVFTPAKRWLILHRAALRALVLGALSLMLFLIAWHFLTKYRVNIYVRFLNVPSPEAVLEKAVRAFHDPRFFNHVALSCRRILIGFSVATVVAVPLGLVMGRFRLMREFVFPVTEVLRPIPAIAWVPMSIMLWPSNEESIVFITFLGSFFPILINTLHGMVMVDPVFVRAAQCLGARETSIFREVYFPAALPHIFTGLTVGMGVAWVSLIAAEMISGQFGIGYFTWEAYSLVQYSDIALGMICIGVLGLASSAAIRGIGRLVMPWSPS
jgi:NitT/TauT family transport system permease protein